MKVFRPSPDEDVTIIDPQAEFAIMLTPALGIEDVAERLAISPRQALAHIADGSVIAVEI